MTTRVSIDLQNTVQARQLLLKHPDPDPEETASSKDDVSFLTAVFMLDRMQPGSTLPQGFVLDAVKLSPCTLLVFCFPRDAEDDYHALVVYFSDKDGTQGVLNWNPLEQNLSELDFDLAAEELKRVQVAPAVFLFFVNKKLAESLFIEGWELVFLNSPLQLDEDGI